MQWLEWMSWKTSSSSCIVVSFASVTEKPTDRLEKLSVHSNRVCSTNCWPDKSESEAVPDHPIGSCITISTVKIGVVSIRRISFRWIDSSSLHGSTFRSCGSMLRDRFFCRSEASIRCNALRAAPPYRRLGRPCSSSYLHRADCEAVRLPAHGTDATESPSLRSGERNFFRDSVARAWRLAAIKEIVGFQSRIHIPTLPPAFSDTKEDTRIFPTNEPVDFFPSAPAGSRNLPLLMVGAH